MYVPWVAPPADRSVQGKRSSDRPGLMAIVIVLGLALTA
jgi:hypothetical protein